MLMILTLSMNRNAYGVESIFGKEIHTNYLGNIKYFLSIDFRSSQAISLSQRQYTLDLPNETRMLGCKPAASPIDPSTELDMIKGGSLSNERKYRG